MRKTFILLAFTIGLAVLAVSCSQPIGPTSEGGLPTPLPVPSPTPMLSAEIIFNVVPPSGTSPSANIELVLLDPVSGLDHNQESITMTPVGDGRRQARVIVPVGSLLYYRYIRSGPNQVQEADSFGNPVNYRLAHIPSPLEFEDFIAAWSDSEHEGETGRILGQLRGAGSDEPLPYFLVSAGGMLTFSDAEGTFRLEGLPIGVHRITVISPDGSFQPAQQGAMIAAERTTAAEFVLLPAQLVRLTFQVTVPGDTIAGVPVRVAGNIRQLGARFGDMRGDSILSSAQMPALFAVDETHFLMITEAYAGTDLRYKYTLGDGLWNAERDGYGALITRQVIVPDEDLTIIDTVPTWHASDRGSVLFRLTVPQNTPQDETVGIQFDLDGWSEPLEMWRLGPFEWIYALHGPLDLDGGLNYRYCRNMQCGEAGSPAELGPEGIHGQITSQSINQNLDDVVEVWRWWEGDQGPPSVVAPEISSREEFEVGMEVMTGYHPRWSNFLPTALDEIASIGANAVTLTPSWVWEHRSPNPVLSFDPATAPYPDEFAQTIEAAQELGLSVGVRVTTQFDDDDPQAWWGHTPHSNNWWAVWFEEYRSFAVTLAQQASQAGVTKLILGGPEVVPSLPGGVFPNGSPSDVPKNAETRWRELVDDVREHFPGQVAFEIEFSDELGIVPSFLDAFDEVHLYWHAPLSQGEDLDFETLSNQATSALTGIFASQPALARMPLIIVAEYLSVHDGRSGCPPAVDGSCRPASDFQHGAIADPDLMVDLPAQTEALNAMLLSAYYRSNISGFYVRGFDPTMQMHDKSASIYGKPSRDMLWYWFQRITGAVADERP
jgi:hypothetical protein